MRIGLLGWHAPTGIGYMNLDMWQLGLATSWLVPVHPKLGVAELPPGDVVVVPVSGGKADVLKFLDNIDILIFVERVFLKDVNIFQECRKRYVLTCCLPMLEFLPSSADTWMVEPNVMWAVNSLAKSRLSSCSNMMVKRQKKHYWQKHIVPCRWGVNNANFVPRVRTEHKEFVFVNGWGGAEQRKGAAAVAAAARLSPELKIRVLSQTPNLPEMPSNVVVDNTNYADRRDLYRCDGWYLAPSRWEGLGLQLWEAYASGMPVITTAASPMDELPGAKLVRCRTSQLRLNSECIVTASDVNVISLAEIMQTVAKQPIESSSRAAIAYAKQHDLSHSFAEMKEILRVKCERLRTR